MLYFRSHKCFQPFRLTNRMRYSSKKDSEKEEVEDDNVSSDDEEKQGLVLRTNSSSTEEENITNEENLYVKLERGKSMLIFPIVS